MTRIQIGTMRESVGFVRVTRDVDQYVIVIGEAGNEVSDTLSDVLWASVVLEVLVVGIDGHRFRGSA
jgi:hypothetical protein